MTGSERQKLFDNSLQTAEGWRAKGDLRWECTCLQKALDALLLIAITDNDSPATGISSMRAHQGSTILNRACELNQQFFEILAGKGDGQIVAVSNDVTLVHIAWLLDEWEIAHRLLAVCIDPRVAHHFPLTKLWREYCRAMDCLSRFEPYDPDIPKVKGYERYWIPYLRLVADIVNALDTSAVREQIAESFATRNADRRLTDWRGHDGDGKQPVKWDFRETSILHFVDCRK